jgi:hypothetical protein
MAGKSDLQVDGDFIAEFESRRDAGFIEQHADEIDAMVDKMRAELVAEEEAHRKLAELKRRFAKLEAGEK